MGIINQSDESSDFMQDELRIIHKPSEIPKPSKTIPITKYMTDTTDLQVGDIAPEFTTLDSNGTSISLSDIISKGSEVILYFYPKDNTPGCTVQACDFRDNMERLASNDLVVLGVSKDSEKSHQNFIEFINDALTFNY